MGGGEVEVGVSCVRAGAVDQFLSVMLVLGFALTILLRIHYRHCEYCVAFLLR